MNKLSIQQRKLVYLAGIVLLLIPIFLLGMPASGQPTPSAQSDSASAGPGTKSGGVLARMRQEHSLGESTLGNVDPTSAVLNFVLLGFRGLAANLLWVEHEEQKKTKQWAQMRATAESIILLQPHYLKVWQYHGWDLAYNVSAQWDGVEDRYYWVKEGCKFLQKGTEQNQTYPELPWEVGHITGQKIGRADEWRQFREFFIVDPDTERFDGRADSEINPEEKDNYLVAKDHFLIANQLEEEYEQHLMQDLLFRHYPARSQFDYAAALNRDGQFDEVSRLAWSEAARDWTEDYGRDQFQSPGGMIFLEVETDEDIADLEEIAEKEDIPLKDKLAWVNRYQNTANYRYWRVRSHSEQEPQTVEAHRLLYEGRQLFKQSRFRLAEESILKGLELYSNVLRRHPELASEDAAIEEGMLAIMYFQSILSLRGEQLPEQFPLKWLWDSKQDWIPLIQEEFRRDNSGA